MPDRKMQQVSLEVKPCSLDGTYMHQWHVYHVDLGRTDRYYYCPGRRVAEQPEVTRD